MLSTGRVSIVGFCVANLSKAVPIAVRYSAVRKQFGTPNKELPVLEYQLQVCYRKYVLGNKLIICSYKKDNIIPITTIFHLYWLVITAVFVILFRLLCSRCDFFCCHIFISNTKDLNDSSNPVSYNSFKECAHMSSATYQNHSYQMFQDNLHLSCLLGLSCLIHFFAISLFANSIFCPLIDAMKPRLVCQPTSFSDWIF